MKLILATTFFLCISQLFAQESYRVYRWENIQKANPDTVFAIDASKLKWKECPKKLFEFKNLKYLNLSKNKLTEFPEELVQMKGLKTLDLTKNQLTNAVQICQLPQLQRLHLARNKVTNIPACIGYLSELKILDIWDNPLNSLPEEVSNLKKLEAVDMRGIMLGPHFQRKWQEGMPQVKWYFDPPCHCEE